VVSKAVFLQPAIESAAAQAERFAGVADVPTITSKSLLNQDALDFLDAHFIEAQRSFAHGAEAEVSGANLAAFGHENGALDGVVQLADIAGPGMVEKKLHGDGLKAFQVLAVTLGGLAKKMMSEERNVFLAFTERRQVNFDGVEAEKKIFAKTAAGDFGLDVGIGGGEDANVDAASSGGANAFEFARLESAQKLGLQVHGDVCDFIEEESATVGEFETPDAIGFCVGERTLHVTEKLAFENAFGEAACVDGDERAADARGKHVESPGDDFLSGAMLAGDENVCVGGADARDQVHHGAHGGGFGDQGGAAIGAEEAVFGFEALAFPQGLREFDLRFENGEKPGVLPRLLDEILGAAAHGFDGKFEAAPGGHDDDGKGAVFRANVGKKVEAFLAGSCVSSVIQIHQESVKLAGLERRKNGSGRGDGFGFKSLAFQKQPEGFADVGLIVGDEDSCACGMWLNHG